MSSPRIYIIASRFNQQLVSQLVTGARTCLEQHGVQPVAEHWVSGAFELPGLAAKLIESRKCDALIALGVVIRGDTPHFDYVCDGVTQGIMQLTINHALPIGYGVLMLNTPQQAAMRASLDCLRVASDHAALQGESNKGFESAQAVLSVLDCFEKIAQ